MTAALQTPNVSADGRIVAGRYEILAILGEEALGRVWSARDRKTGRLVQIKALTPDLARDPVRSARFGREMIASFAVTDPNTLEVLDYGEDRGTQFLVLEFVAGTALSEIVAHGPLAPERSARIIAQIATALDAAHAQGVVHRSLSPDTVLLLDNAIGSDFVKVRDFGLSKHLAPSLDPTPAATEITASGMRLGDARYMPPEYVTHGDFGPPGDLYALGVVAYHLLTGEPPYQGSRRDVLARHVSGAVPRPSERMADVPPYLDRLVVALLDKAPERRPTVPEVVARIEQGLGTPLALPLLAPLDAEGRPLVPRRHVETVRRKPPPNSRNAALGAASVFALLVLLALLGMVLYTMATSS